MGSLRKRAERLLTILAVGYAGALVLWWVLRHLLGDGTWWLFLANAFALCVFLPAPLLVVLAVIRRRTSTVLAALMVVVLFGVDVAPPLGLGRVEAAGGPAFSVMSYNMLAYNRSPEVVIHAIREGGADVVAIQELNGAAAQALQAELRPEYPYQLLDPRETTEGAGIVSRFPLRVLDERLPGTWVGVPQLVAVTVDGKEIVVVNAHTTATNFGGVVPQPGTIAWTVADRERQARALAAFAEQERRPVICAVDFNATEWSRSYSIVTRSLLDSWREGGSGFGHTFPGADSPGSARPHIGPYAVPKWLVRIDYVFHSRGVRVVDARIGPWDGVSDHRSIVVRFALDSAKGGP